MPEASVIELAQDISGTLTHPQVMERAGNFWGHLKSTGIRSNPLSRNEILDPQLLRKFWAVFSSHIHQGYRLSLQLPPHPKPGVAVHIDGQLMDVLPVWPIKINLARRQKLPLVIIQAFSMAAEERGYQPFLWEFNSQEPFPEAWANDLMANRSVAVDSF